MPMAVADLSGNDVCLDDLDYHTLGYEAHLCQVPQYMVMLL